MCLITSNRVLLYNLIKDYPEFYGIRNFIAVFITARHFFFCWARWIHFTPSHPIFLRSISIYAHVFQALCFPTTPGNTLISVVCPIHPTHLGFLNLIMFCEDYQLSTFLLYSFVNPPFTSSTLEPHKFLSTCSRIPSTYLYVLLLILNAQFLTYRRGASRK